MISLRVLITTIFQYPHEGGMSTHITTLKKGLEQLGHQVDVISGSGIPKIKQLFFARLPSFILNRLNKGTGQLIGDLQRMRMLRKKIKKVYQNYDVINSQDIFATIAAKSFNTRVIQTVHGYYTYEATSRGAIKEGSKQAIRAKELEKIAYNTANKLICVDQRIKNYIKDETGIEGHVIHNFIDINIFNIPDEEMKLVKEKYELPSNKRILLVPRRLTEKNGVIYPLLALPEIIKEIPDVFLVYAGSGEQMELLKSKVKELKITNHVKFLGSVPHKDMIAIYKLAEIVIVPSIHAKGVEEATSIAALEGMAAGKVVIAGAVGGLKELINHGENGLLFEEKNVRELKDSILNVLFNDMSHIKQKTREIINNNHSHLSAAKKFVEHYIKNDKV